MNNKHFILLIIFVFSVLSQLSVKAQQNTDPALLTIDRIYNSDEFRQDYMPPTQWVSDGDAYVKVEYDRSGINELVQYNCASGKNNKILEAQNIRKPDSQEYLKIESFSFSKDESKILIFTNSSRVWRANTKGDYWVYDRNNKKLSQLGSGLGNSSLMFAKFSDDNKSVAYVHDFNLYVEDFRSSDIKRLTFDGTGDIINGTFDWVYEEEFGCRDGFRWSPDGKQIGYWQLDASSIGTHYMINNTDSIYSQPIPLQYPKVGDPPSSCKVGVVSADSGDTKWIDIPGVPNQNYIPSLQWANDDLLIIMQLNRKQNHLIVYGYIPSKRKLYTIYEEREDTWVDIYYPDISAAGWSANDLTLLDDGQSFLRMVEDGWRTVYKIDVKSGKKLKITKGEYDVASISGMSATHLYFIASPENSTQRYLYSERLDGTGRAVRLTPVDYIGVNKYNISQNGKYAIHSFNSVMEPLSVRLVSLPDHRTIETLVDNKSFISKTNTLALPDIDFFSIEIEPGVSMDGRMILPVGFDENKKYPVIFHIYGEPWGQTGTDAWIGMWNIMLAQKGYIIIDMDNRGTPCLKGSEWRKSIYRKIGVINSDDQAKATREVLKWKFVDAERTAVWGWSGGGSMTLNQMFRYPELYKTGISVAPVSFQLVYDNIYQERYMGLPSENMQDFVNGSPITNAKNLNGNLLLIHGTADDNVHYQSAELLINELIKHDKQFDMMSYPNRSHGIWEGENTSRHLYTLMTDYLLEHIPVNTER